MPAPTPIPAPAPIPTPAPIPSPAPVASPAAEHIDNASEPIDTPSISEDDSAATNQANLQPAPLQQAAVSNAIPATPDVAATPDQITAPATPTNAPKKKNNLLVDFIVIVLLLVIIAGLVYVIKYKSSSL
jgi:hypothetical protein